jgi:hypothetical protein
MSRDSEFEALQESVKSLEADLKANTLATNQVVQNTAELIAAFEALKGAFKVLEFIGKLSKPILFISLAGGVLTGLWLGLERLLRLKI